MKIFRIALLLFWLPALASLALVSCKKDEPAATPAPAAPTFTCYDGIRNGTETGVDCGGNCAPCVTSGCNPAPKTVQFQSPNTSLSTTFDSFTCEPDNPTNTYRITGSNIESRLTILLVNGRPNSSKVYTIVNQNPNAASTASVSFFAGSSIYRAKGGKLYVNVASGSLTASFCNVTFSPESSGSQLVGSGKAVCF